MRKILAGLLALWIMLSGTALAEEAEPAGAGEAAAETVKTGEDAAEDAGAGDAGAEARLTEDPEGGRWEYVSPDLTIRIERTRETVTYKKKNYLREYCVADIRASAESPLRVILTEPTKKQPAGYKQVSPELLDQKGLPIFAMSDDMYGIRLRKFDYKGVVVREGEVMATKTRNSEKRRYWPNLDTMALLPDGSMKTYVCDTFTAEEYLAMGAKQVFSFGPILLSEGQINPEVLNPKYYPYNEPRVALGMIEPWHYIAIVVRGRPKGQYQGVHLDWLAQKMQELGCVEALNLDGGGTATMMFNGKMIITGDKGLRSQGSMIAFGQRSAPAEEKGE